MSDQEHQTSSATTSGTPPIADAAPVPGELKVGDHVGPYRLMQRIGEGGFGVVFAAEQEWPIRRRVALKVIKPGMDTREVIARFEAERQALAVMGHPGVAAVHDAGATAQGRPYFVMEYVQGEPITGYCDRHRLSVRARLELLVEVCGALQHAHSKGIVHRDLKPSNILVAELDGRPVPKVIDFGVAKATNQRLTEKTIFTEQGRIIGTPEYMSPEQAEMTGLDVDGRTDVYSLGVVLYELLTGTLPLDKRALRAAGYEAIQRMIREVEPPKPSTRLSRMGEGVSGGPVAAAENSPAREVRERLPRTAATIARERGTDPAALRRMLRGDLDWITMKALEKERVRRYVSPQELAADVSRYLRGEPVATTGLTLRRMARRLLARHWIVMSGLCVLIMLLALARSGFQAFVAGGLLVGSISAWWAVVEVARARREADGARAQVRRLRAILGLAGVTLVAIMTVPVYLTRTGAPTSGTALAFPSERDEQARQEAIQQAEAAHREADALAATTGSDEETVGRVIDELLDSLRQVREQDPRTTTRQDFESRVARLRLLTRELRTACDPVAPVVDLANKAADRAARAAEQAFPDQRAQAEQVMIAAKSLRQEAQSVVSLRVDPAAQETAVAELHRAIGDLKKLTMELQATTNVIRGGPVLDDPRPLWRKRLGALDRRIAAIPPMGEPGPDVLRAELAAISSQIDAADREGFGRGNTRTVLSLAEGINRQTAALDARIGALDLRGTGLEARPVGKGLDRLKEAETRATELLAQLALGYFPHEIADGRTSVILAFSDLQRQDGFADWESTSDVIRTLRARIGSLGALAGADTPSALARLADLANDTQNAAAEALVAWERLARPEETAWPSSGEDWTTARLALAQLGQVLARVGDDARRRELDSRVAGQARGLWKRCMDRLAWDNDAEVEAARDSMEAFGASTADLSPRARFNWLLYDFKGDLAEALDAGPNMEAIRTSAARFASDVGDLDETLRGEPRVDAAVEAARSIAEGGVASQAVDFGRLGPGTCGWLPRVAVRDGVATVTYSSPNRVELEFAPIDTATGAVYLSTTEVSLAVFLEAVDGCGNPGLWEEIRSLRLLPVATDAASPDPRYGPQAWQWPPSDTRPRVSRPLERPGFDQGKGWLVLLPAMRDTPSYPPELIDKIPEPSAEMPMQQLSGTMAILASRLLGCRLPTSAEWASARAAEEAAAGQAGVAWRPNLRDRTWGRQKDYCAQIAMASRAVSPVVWPDDGAFRPFGGGAIKVKSAAVPATEEDDGALWLEPASSGGGVLFRHLIGNVAEFVWDGPSLEGAEIRTAAQAEQFVGAQRVGDRLKVIGASALAAREILDQASVALPCAMRKGAYSDVGFRMAFTASDGGEGSALQTARGALGLAFLPP